MNMETSQPRHRDAPYRIAVLGGGMAGATCAAGLRDSGHQVTVLDKARGVGGRLATRRTDWAGPPDQAAPLAFDHGAPCFTARTPAFQDWCDQARQQGLLRPWSPRLAPASRRLHDTQWLAQPDMPELCRRQLSGVRVLPSHRVQQLSRIGTTWQLMLDDGRQLADLDAVVLAMPPAQAADLLPAHRADWAVTARHQPMQPCWTLMALSDHPPPATWDAAAPHDGPLAWAVVNQRKPGRPDLHHGTAWVAQATAGWSEAHLHDHPDEVMAALQLALQQLPGVGQLVGGRATVHRWLYASAQNPPPPGPPWWDGQMSLGVCGDWLGGGGVEGAWLSGRALARAIGAAVPARAPRPVAAALDLHHIAGLSG
jgi:renalase